MLPRELLGQVARVGATQEGVFRLVRRAGRGLALMRFPLHAAFGAREVGSESMP